MDYRVIISKPALRDLGTIARFIAQGAHGSPAAAEKIGEELIALSESLATLPYRGWRFVAGPAFASCLTATT